MENLVVCANKKITLDKFMSQVKIVSQNMIKKVLNVSAESVVNGCDISNETVTISGTIKVDLLYMNMENKVESASSESDFIEKQKFSYILSDCFVKDSVFVSDFSFSSNEILCCVTHNTEIYGIYRYNLPNFASENETIIEDNIKFNLLKFISSADDEFSVAEETETNLKNIEVLKTNTQVVVDEVVASVDKIVVDGRVLCDFIYKDDINVLSGFKQLEFKQEIQAEGVEPTMKVTALAKIKSSVVANEVNDEKNSLTYNFQVYLKCYAHEEVEYQIANDIFDLKSDISTVYDYIELQNYNETIEQSESLLSQTDISQIEDFDDIIGVFEPKIEVVKIDNTSDKAEVCSKARAYVLYKSQDDIKRLDIEEEFKFDILKDVDKKINNVILNCQMVSYKVKAGKEIELVLKINCHADAVTEFSARYVKSFEILAEKKLDELGIKVYVTRHNESIFDVAKALNVMPNIIRNQNQVDDMFEAGQKVYVYSPINLL